MYCAGTPRAVETCRGGQNGANQGGGRSRHARGKHNHLDRAGNQSKSQPRADTKLAQSSPASVLLLAIFLFILARLRKGNNKHLNLNYSQPTAPRDVRRRPSSSSSSFFFSLTVLSFSRCAASRAKSRTEASTAPPSHPTTHLFPTVCVTVKRKK